MKKINVAAAPALIKRQDIAVRRKARFHRKLIVIFSSLLINCGLLRQNFAMSGRQKDGKLFVGTFPKTRIIVVATIFLAGTAKH
jgi:hypothetical protein